MLVQRFLRSLTWVVLLWFTKDEMSKVKQYIDLDGRFFEQYKFNIEIASNREEAPRNEQQTKRNLQGVYSTMVSWGFSGPAPRTDKEHVTDFLPALSRNYYDCLIAQVGASFPNLFTEKRIEDGLKTDKLKDYQELFEQASTNNCWLSKRAFLNRKKKQRKESAHHLRPSPKRFSL